MKVKKITIDPDPYEPLRLAQGYRVGELLFISGQAAIDGRGKIVGRGDFDAQAKQVSPVARSPLAYPMPSCAASCLRHQFWRAWKASCGESSPCRF